MSSPSDSGIYIWDRPLVSVFCILSCVVVWPVLFKWKNHHWYSAPKCGRGLSDPANYQWQCWEKWGLTARETCHLTAVQMWEIFLELKFFMSHFGQSVAISESFFALFKRVLRSESESVTGCWTANWVGWKHWNVVFYIQCNQFFDFVMNPYKVISKMNVATWGMILFESWKLNK
jgi:hypothetical protein